MLLTIRFYISIFFLFILASCYSQSDSVRLKPKQIFKVSHPSNGTVIDTISKLSESKTTLITSWITPEVAEMSDLQNGVTLFYYGNSSLTRKDERFAKKYKIKYMTRGCIRWSDEDLKGYNLVILRRLEEKYGSRVLTRVRSDLY